MIEKIRQITDKISMNCFETSFRIRVEHDNEFENGRIFIQITYVAHCSKTGEIKEWHGRKWYLSKYMTEDEIIKTVYVAFKSCVEHEVMEGFKVNGVPLFNPHVDYLELLNISHKEVQRENV